MIAFNLLRPVVTQPEDHGVVSTAKIVDRIEDLSSAIVDFGEDVCIGAVAGLAGKIWVGRCRKMGVRISHKCEERLPRPVALAHEGNGPLRAFGIDRSSRG